MQLPFWNIYASIKTKLNQEIGIDDYFHFLKALEQLPKNSLQSKTDLALLMEIFWLKDLNNQGGFKRLVKNALNQYQEDYLKISRVEEPEEDLNLNSSIDASKEPKLIKVKQRFPTMKQILPLQNILLNRKKAILYLKKKVRPTGKILSYLLLLVKETYQKTLVQKWT